MMDEVGNLVLEHLKALRGEVRNIRDEQRSMRAELTAIRLDVRATTTLVEQVLEDVATIRLDRIERRLELVDAPN